MIREIDPVAARSLIHSGGEVGFLDIREAGQFGEGHPLFAVPCPYSRLEAEAGRLVPRKNVPLLLIDGGNNLAGKAADSLSRLGYIDISIVAGGAPGWDRAGFTLFKGVNVPSKTLGELAEHEWQPDIVTSATLLEWSEAGKVALFDARPPVEFKKMHLPDAVCLPNGELAYRLAALRLPDDRPMIVACAGRTRGIVGAIGLKLMGHAGPVYALENGTQGWALAGQELERGVAAAPFVPLDSRARAAGKEKADDFLRRWDIPIVSSGEVQGLLANYSQTTFVFDVRSEAEALADPLPIAQHVPSGQIVQATDQFVGVRNARLVLCDDLGIRAGLAAFWLRQLGYRPVVTIIDDALRELKGEAAADVPMPFCPASLSAPAALEEWRLGEAVLIDLRGSPSYRAGHVEGAVWATRAGMRDLIAQDSRRLLLIADDDAVLLGAVCELDGIYRRDIAVVDGGHAALLEAGAKKIVTPSLPSDEEAIDFLRFVHDRHDGNLDASRRYLAWEMGLVTQLDAAERREFTLTSARPG